MAKSVSNIALMGVYSENSGGKGFTSRHGDYTVGYRAVNANIGLSI
jgi:hypothetical protein